MSAISTAADEPTKLDVMKLVNESSDRLVSNMDREVSSDVDMDTYETLLSQNDARAMRKAYDRAKAEGINGHLRRAFEKTYKNAVDDPAGWFQVLVTASLAV
jgi:hypothetical protein